MARITSSVALLAVGIALTGCAPLMVKKKALISNRTVYSENQPVVQRTDYAFDVATDSSGVPREELVRLGDWFDTLQLRYGDRIALEDPSGRSAVQADVQRVVGGYGMMLTPGAPLTPGAVPFGSARIIVTRSKATVPGCPNWRQSSLTGAPISTESNFGCATNSMIAAMIADPNDLVRGQDGEGSADADTASKAIRVYREKDPSGKGGLEKVSTTGGN